MASASSERTNSSTPDAFFLRPFLTGEEFEYWNSHFCHVPSSRSFVRASNQQNTTTVTSGQHMTSCVRNVTGTPCCDDRHKIGVPAVHGLSSNSCSKTRSGEMPCLQGNIPSSIATNRGTINAKVCGQCPYSTKTSVKENASLEKGYSGNPFCLEYSAPCTSQTGQTGNQLDMYLVYGDESFGKKPPPFISSGHREVYSNTGSAVLSDSMTASNMHSELGSINSFPAKMKFIGTSKHDTFRQGKEKRPCVSDEANGIQQDQVPSKIVHSNETWSSRQWKRPRISDCRCKDARCKINDSRELTMPLVQDCVEENINTSISGDSTSGTECRPGSKTFKETQPTTTDLTENISDTTLKSRVWQVDDQIPNGWNKPLERKNIDEIIKTTKPVQRKLMTNNRTGGCAFDHDSLPRLIGVLSPSAIATVMSSLTK